MKWLSADQYGNKIILRGRFPRSALLDHCGRRHADIIYQDRKDGGMVKVGWIVAGSWWSVYKLEPLQVPA